MPRFILGAALIFWAVMCEQILLGVLFAIICESKSIVQIRWDFSAKGYRRAWHICMVLLIGISSLIMLEKPAHLLMVHVLVWLPLILIPLQFVQAYGFKSTIPLSIFSFLAEARRRRNAHLGSKVSAIEVDFGNIYFTGIIVASTLGSQANTHRWAFLLGLVVLLVWVLWASGRAKPLPLLCGMLLALALAGSALKGIERVQDWVLGYTAGGDWRSSFDPKMVSTMIGKPGEVVLSPDILWRLRAERGQRVPKLLRNATYDQYRPATWENKVDAGQPFQDLDRDVNDFILLNQEAGPRATANGLPRFELRGAVRAESPLPLPGDASSLFGFELDGIERNSLGTVRVFPKFSVIEGQVLWQAGTQPDAPPNMRDDLRISRYEKRFIQSVGEEIGINELENTKDKVRHLQQWFAKNFKYSTHLTIYSSSYVASYSTGLSQFLNNTRSGHCEYFATAATLLLRESGVPARYATGFAVNEYDKKRNEYIIRGKHGHAWCRVWDEQSNAWFDFDPTPPQWLPMASQPDSWMQPYQDRMKLWREDFFLWRNQPENRLAGRLILTGIVASVLGFIAYRLWKSRVRVIKSNRRGSFHSWSLRTPFHDLEKLAVRQLGPRPEGATFAHWMSRLCLADEQKFMLDEAIRLHQRIRFDPEPTTPDDHAQLTKLCVALGNTLKRIQKKSDRKK